MKHKPAIYTSVWLLVFFYFTLPLCFNRKFITLREKNAFRTALPQLPKCACYVHKKDFAAKPEPEWRGGLFFCFHLPVENQDLILDGFGLQGCILPSPPQAQTSRGQALGLRDPLGEPRCNAGFSGQEWKIHSQLVKTFFIFNRGKLNPWIDEIK